MDLKQYQIVLVNLDPTIGSEMKKTPPCVIISPNEMNKYLQTIVVAPMTSSSKPYPTRIEVKHNKKKGWIFLDQIRTVDRQRIVKILGNLAEKEISNVKAIIKETYVD
ncbi:MAG: type II toxin-antitoxin system PemK/MazF family toxin [Ginsengibacter sp.]